MDSFENRNFNIFNLHAQGHITTDLVYRIHRCTNLLEYQYHDDLQPKRNNIGGILTIFI